jgi:hypothetical protein
VITAAVLLGVMRGLFTLLPATVIAGQWDTSAQGSFSGLFATPITTALAPWAAPALAGVAGSYSTLFVVVAALIATSTILGLLRWRRVTG